MRNLAPVALFTFNRPDHLIKTLTALSENPLASRSDLYAFSDGPRTPADIQSIKRVREILKQDWGFRSISVVERSKNLGLAESVISGVSEVIEKFGKIIVLEDDMITSPLFLEFMNQALDRYQTDSKVISIHAYIYPMSFKPESAFFLKGADCWGWGTWKSSWQIFHPSSKELYERLKENKLLDRFNYFGAGRFIEMLKDHIEGKNNSWAIRWYASALIADKLTLYPPESFVHNIGFDDTGTHCGKSDVFSVELARKLPLFPEVPLSENRMALKEFEKFFWKLRPRRDRFFALIKKLC